MNLELTEKERERIVKLAKLLKITDTLKKTTRTLRLLNKSEVTNIGLILSGRNKHGKSYTSPKTVLPANLVKEALEKHIKQLELKVKELV